MNNSARAIGANDRTPHHKWSRRARPLPPSQDAFYQPPRGYEHAQPGSVFRSRDVKLAFLGLIPQRVTATQLLYRTADRLGNPEATVTTVLTPAEYDRQQPGPILSYQCAIDAVSDRCFPSYALRRRARLFSNPQLEYVLIAAALAQGWVVSVPDHEGPNGLLTAPYEPGYRALDGIRAAISVERLGLSADSPVGLWGYSGGGLASAWAAEVAPQYAPELNIVGAVLGSPAADPGRMFRRLNGGLASGLPALAVAALARAYPELEQIIQTHVNPKGRALLRRVETMTTSGAAIRMVGRNLGRYCDRPLEEILSMPEVQHVFEDVKLGKMTPAAPVLIIQAVHDLFVPIGAIDTLAEFYSSGGANVSYHRDIANEHVLLAGMSPPMALAWLRDRFAARPLTDHPTRTRWPLLLSGSAYLGLLRLAIVAAKVLTGRRLRRTRAIASPRRATPLPPSAAAG